jgi:hypothetical protein
MLLHTLAGIAWDPQLRGFLTVAVGAVVLLGSTTLLLATNIGSRLGVLLAATAFFGWLTIMGGVWWVYGNIGMLGEIPSWKVVETVYPGTEAAGTDEAHTLDTSGLPPAAELNDMEPTKLAEIQDDLEKTTGGWKLLPESDPAFGEAKAAVDAYFLAHPDETLEVKAAEDYIATYSFEQGGKEGLPANPSRVDRLWKKFKNTFLELTHPPHYAIIQVQPVVKQEAEAGQPPPKPKADEDKPVVSVIMERDLGSRRLPGAMLTLFSGIMFAVLATQLHRRDQRVAEVRALTPAEG